MTTRTPSDVEPEENLKLKTDEPEELDEDAADEATAGDDAAVDEDWDEDAEDAEDAEGADGDESEGSDSTEALDELEAEELEMLTEDEASETLPVDEAEELRAIRRAQLSLNQDGSGERESDEFQCQSCFLVLKTSQLADKRRKFCRDCAG